ncbi:hypothetical protein F0L68_20585 [Solihabitans fulvus]|uniref:S-adenosyl methyltransferase n=1 Tax=Solihabitans fulvus TaxID=1892852 RepID=A0A5B2XAF0_9PSEU|nr:SAM-dependent methyltransferase [Solihabitans fulvus]KAA2260125.1 hypothetical protein F0L68_20585 [Solihabitans fulvus]
MERPNWAPGDIDVERASVARVYDYWLGGAHNFAADRAAARQALEAMPELKSVILTNRAFLRRAVRYLASVGIRQFLDLGSGIPTVGNVHEVAGQVDPTTRVVYVDIDPVAVAHGRAILAEDPNVTMVRADVRDTASVLESAEIRKLFDPTEPVAVLMIALLHFMPDETDPYGMVATYRDSMPSGSYLAVSHAGFESGEEPFGWRRARDLYERQVTPMTNRTGAEFARFFEGFDLVEPGQVRIPLWRPDSPDDVEETAARYPGFGAVGRKP